MSLFGDPFVLAVDLIVNDETFAGFTRLQSQIRAATADVTALKAELASIGIMGGMPAGIIAGSEDLLANARAEADVRAAMYVDVAANEERILALRTEALNVARQEAEVRRAAAASTPLGTPAIRSQINRLGNVGLESGGGILAMLAFATQERMRFDQTALETDMALGGYERTPAQRANDIRALQSAAMAGSEATGFFSAQDILEGLKAAASAGARPLVQRMGMDAFTAIAPALARYMDVLGRIKGESADQAAMDAIRTAHMFGAYNAQDISRTLNAQAMLALLMPDKMSTAMSAMAYAVPSGVQLAGISQEAILALVASADQTGLGRGRSGARLKNYIETLAVVQSRQREQAKAALGLHAALDQHGAVDLMRSFEILEADAKRLGPQRYRDLVRTAFGAQGDLVAAVFGDPRKQAIFNANRQVIDQSLQRGDLTTIQNILKGGEIGKEAQALARLKNDILEFGRYGVPIAVRFFDALNPRLKAFSDWADSHPDEAKRVFDGLFDLGAGLLAVGGALKVVAWISGLASALAALAKWGRQLWQVFETVVRFAKNVADGVGEVASKFKGVVSGVSEVAGDLGAFAAGLSRIANPLGAIVDILSLSGDSGHEDIRKSSYEQDLARARAAWARGAVHGGDIQGATFRGLPAHQTIHIHVDHPTFMLPRGTPQSQGRAAFQHFLNLTGAIGTSPYLPSPITVSGAAFGRS